MNSIHCCIVFSDNESKARSKIKEIASTLNNPKITMGRGFARCASDDEEWVWIRPSMDAARGYRAHKAWIDEDCSIKQLNLVIDPACVFCEESSLF